MLKKALLYSLLICISGCDTNFSSLAGLRPIKWATVDKSRIRLSIAEKFIDENPYPEEIAKNSDEIRLESARLEQQISDLTSLASTRCMETSNNGDNAATRTTAPESASRLTSAVGFSGGMVLANNSKYQQCMIALKDDQLILGLREKISKNYGIATARQKHDRMVMEKTNKYIEEVIAKYAEANHFDLVIAKSSEEIPYNKSKVILDITDAVLSSMSESHPK